MHRFRVTIIAICLILGWLGYTDLSLLLRNSEPLNITIADLNKNGAPREWLTINDGHQDLLKAINMSGTMEIGSFLVPLKRSPDAVDANIWFETRDPQIIKALKEYYFKLETKQQQEDYLKENQALFSAQISLTGMTVDNLAADSNRTKLEKLLQEMNIPIPENTIFISEGKEPAVWRGIFFMGIAIIGLIKVFYSRNAPA